MSDIADSIAPQNRDDACAVIVLYSLSGYSKDQLKARNLTDQKVEIARDVLNFFDLDYTNAQVAGMCRWASLRLAKPKVWRALAEDNANHNGTCGICNTPRKYCQLPPWYKRGTWHNPEWAPKQPGICIHNRLYEYILNGMLVFPESTGWPVLESIKTSVQLYLEDQPLEDDGD